MSEIERIRDQIRRAFEGDAWHGPALWELLRDVNVQVASAKPAAGVHSIWEIVLHVRAWTQVVTRRLRGEEVKPTAAEDWAGVEYYREDAWLDERDQLRSAHTTLMLAIEGVEDSALEKIVAGEKYSIYFMLHGLIQHYLYHAGQIAILKRALT
jgi:uncharacterized damage-inducible protein DinB